MPLEFPAVGCEGAIRRVSVAAHYKGKRGLRVTGGDSSQVVACYNTWQSGWHLYTLHKTLRSLTPNVVPILVAKQRSRLTDMWLITGRTT